MWCDLKPSALLFSFDRVSGASVDHQRRRHALVPERDGGRGFFLLNLLELVFVENLAMIMCLLL